MLHNLRSSADLFATGLGWVAFTVLGMIAVGADHPPAIWFAEAVTVAAFLESRKTRWLTLVAFLAPVFFLTLTVMGLPAYLALIWTATSLLEAVIVAAISLRVLGGRGRLPTNIGQLLGLWGSAIAGVTIASCIGVLLQPEANFEMTRWWYAAKLIGLMASVQFLRFVLCNYRLGKGLPSLLGHGEFTGWLIVTTGIAWLGVTWHWAALTLLVSSVVFGSIRFGSIFAPAMVITAAIVAIGADLSGRSIVPMPGGSQLGDLFVLQMVMIVMLCTALPISAIMDKRAQLKKQLIARNENLHDNITILGLAEQLAGIGRYRIGLKDGKQNWSPTMLELHGLPRELAPDPGDLKRILPDKGERLFFELEQNKADPLPYTFDYQAKPLDGPERILRMSMLNEFDREGERVAVFGVAIDVTDQIRREEALDLARGRAVRLAAEAQKIANTDALTGLPNRRCTFARLDAMIDRAHQASRPLAAIMFDIDHFKKVNDTFGHKAGDDVLVKVAQLSRQQTRSEDLVGRIGGEEFVWLLPGVPAREVTRLAERLRQAIEKGTRDSEHPHVTASIGMAMYGPNDTVETLLARADAALYEAKEGGRNQVKRAA